MKKVVIRVKPIFHKKVNGLALGICVGIDPQHETFALLISTCWYQGEWSHTGAATCDTSTDTTERHHHPLV